MGSTPRLLNELKGHTFREGEIVKACFGHKRANKRYFVKIIKLDLLSAHIGGRSHDAFLCDVVYRKARVAGLCNAAT